MLRASLALLALVGCSKPNECKLAVERLARISARMHQPWNDKSADFALESCRNGAGKYDPVLRCALDEKSDDAAGKCIERALAEVLKGYSGSGNGSGLNPLLEE